MCPPAARHVPLTCPLIPADDFDGAELETMWNTYDADRSGALDAGELEQLLNTVVAAVGGDASCVPQLAAATVTCMDRDGDGDSFPRTKSSQNIVYGVGTHTP